MADLDLDKLEATAQAVNESYEKLMAGRGGHVYDNAPPEVKALFWEHWNNVESLNLAWTATARLALIARIRQQDKALGIAHDDIMHDGEVVKELEARIRELEGAEARGRVAGLRGWLPEVYVALEKLGAPNSLLAIFGSATDTLGDEACLDLLRAYNREGSYMAEQRAAEEA